MSRYITFLKDYRKQKNWLDLCSLTILSCVLSLQVKSVFGAKMFALGVVVKIPVPKQTAKTNFQVTTGRAKYNPSIDCLVWKWVYIIFPPIHLYNSFVGVLLIIWFYLLLFRIRKFPGQTESTLSAEIELISTMGEKKSWTRPPIQMEFQVSLRLFWALLNRTRFA